MAFYRKKLKKIFDEIGITKSLLKKGDNGWVHKFVTLYGKANNFGYRYPFDKISFWGRGSTKNFPIDLVKEVLLEQYNRENNKNES